ncbi:hypothetical protein [Duganella hordei]|uniref:hypothetical protein n=1 Tax=Duganella hordei TaxID=2865934 RepID=UPI00333EDF55
MGFVTCSATHRFARRGNVHLQRDIDAACPECHKHDTLRWLDLFNDEFVATTTCTDDLFEEGGQLNHLYRAVVRTSAHEAGALQWEFERRVNVPSRQGMVLSYLAQALRNDGMEAAQDDYEHLGVRPEAVVVVTLAIQDGQPLFFIGVNGHDNTYQAAESFCNAMPADICDVPCIHVFERDPHANVGVRLGYDVSGWSWHGEQKVLRTIKEDHGLMARLSTTCIGIAHRSGPCTPHTAGHGSQGCFSYLDRKYGKDEKRFQMVGHHATATCTVAAYWYALPDQANNVSYRRMQEIVAQQLRDREGAVRQIQHQPQLRAVSGIIGSYL